MKVSPGLVRGLVNLTREKKKKKREKKKRDRYNMSVCRVSLCCVGWRASLVGRCAVCVYGCMCVCGYVCCARSSHF